MGKGRRGAVSSSSPRTRPRIGGPPNGLGPSWSDTGWRTTVRQGRSRWRCVRRSPLWRPAAWRYSPARRDGAWARGLAITRSSTSLATDAAGLRCFAPSIRCSPRRRENPEDSRAKRQDSVAVLRRGMHPPRPRPFPPHPGNRAAVYEKPGGPRRSPERGFASEIVEGRDAFRVDVPARRPPDVRIGHGRRGRDDPRWSAENPRARATSAASIHGGIMICPRAALVVVGRGPRPSRCASRTGARRRARTTRSSTRSVRSRARTPAPELAHGRFRIDDRRGRVRAGAWSRYRAPWTGTLPFDAVRDVSADGSLQHVAGPRSRWVRTLPREADRPSSTRLPRAGESAGTGRRAPRSAGELGLSLAGTLGPQADRGPLRHSASRNGRPRNRLSRRRADTTDVRPARRSTTIRWNRSVAR